MKSKMKCLTVQQLINKLDAIKNKNQEVWMSSPYDDYLELGDVEQDDDNIVLVGFQMIKITDDFSCTLEGFQGVQKQYAIRSYDLYPTNRRSFVVTAYACNKEIIVYQSRNFIVSSAYRICDGIPRFPLAETIAKEITELEIEYDKCKIECDNVWNRIMSEYEREKNDFT